MKRKAKNWLSILAATLLSIFLLAPSAMAQSAQSCKKFVQSFYTWYIPQMTQNVPIPCNERILKEKASYFSPTLLAMLREDQRESAKVTDEIVGLDFDPYINGQETPKRYLAGKASRRGKGYLVEVFDVSEGKKGKDPAVIPELVFSKGKWVFTNFHYYKTSFAANENLISILKIQKEARRKYVREHKTHSSTK